MSHGIVIINYTQYIKVSQLDASNPFPLLSLAKCVDEISVLRTHETAYEWRLKLNNDLIQEDYRKFTNER